MRVIVWPDLEQPRLAAADRSKRFAPHDVARARSADEAVHAPIGVDQRSVAQMRTDG
jgi:hypothetical protein